MENLIWQLRMQYSTVSFIRSMFSFYPFFWSIQYQSDLFLSKKHAEWTCLYHFWQYRIITSTNTPKRGRTKMLTDIWYKQVIHINDMLNTDTHTNKFHHSSFIQIQFINSFITCISIVVSIPKVFTSVYNHDYFELTDTQFMNELLP